MPDHPVAFTLTASLSYRASSIDVFGRKYCHRKLSCDAAMEPGCSEKLSSWFKKPLARVEIEFSDNLSADDPWFGTTNFSLDEGGLCAASLPLDRAAFSRLVAFCQSYNWCDLEITLVIHGLDRLAIEKAILTDSKNWNVFWPVSNWTIAYRDSELSIERKDSAT